MAELLTLARPYAKAAFEYALGENDLAGWSQNLGLAAAVSDVEEAQVLLSSPTYTADQLTEAFAGLFDPVLPQAMVNLLATLADNKRLLLLPAISNAFEAMKAEQEQQQRVEITSAFEIDDAQVAALGEALKAKLNKVVDIRVDVDAELIGGVIIRAGDMVIDNSLQGRLARLGDTLN